MMKPELIFAGEACVGCIPVARSATLAKMLRKRAFVIVSV